jgi:hypothetical protein
MNYWIFKYNPQLYRIDDRLNDPSAEITWKVSKYRREIQAGDTGRLDWPNMHPHDGTLNRFCFGTYAYGQAGQLGGGARLRKAISFAQTTQPIGR